MIYVMRWHSLKSTRWKNSLARSFMMHFIYSTFFYHALQTNCLLLSAVIEFYFKATISSIVIEEKNFFWYLFVCRWKKTHFIFLSNSLLYHSKVLCMQEQIFEHAWMNWSVCKMKWNGEWEDERRKIRKRFLLSF
jgi:hypothetical protein